MTKTKNIGFKRRRKALTNYKKRLPLVKSYLNRVVIRKSNKRIIAQIVKYEEQGHKILAHTDSSKLIVYGWPSRSNKATAYLTGLLLSKMLKKKKFNSEDEYILDIGLSTPVKNSIPFVFAKGCIDGGMKLRSGAQVDVKSFDYSNTSYIAELKKDNAVYERHFSGYLKSKITPENLGALFKTTKDKIINE